MKKGGFSEGLLLKKTVLVSRPTSIGYKGLLMETYILFMVSSFPDVNSNLNGYSLLL